MDKEQLPLSLLQPRRKITGFSAILLPLDSDGEIDWETYASHLSLTIESGLIPAVNMDTGYVHLIDDAIREQALEITQSLVGGGPFVAGAFVSDQPGDAFDLDGYSRQMEMIQAHGGAPVIFQSFGLTQQPDSDIIASYEAIGERTDSFYGFELTTMLAPFGKVYSLDVYQGLLGIRRCLGAKHSSFRREPEWERLELRNRIRPEFRVMTGNDLAIDMVMYGSDYLLGLSTFAPDWFAKRDALWEAGDPAFYELNDQLQYLGFFSFRDPGPAYKHSAAMFLAERGMVKSDRTYPGSPTRPASDREIFAAFLRNFASSQ
ncbi:Dihydrodipicolinate synthase/N-acetylneuraminate lyase [Planctomycetales bacterium 10988]|nr:Dihydrodipicolinate synthase/N-acetylneuraminate lyase [Planctomycetales bacterium 10988]